MSHEDDDYDDTTIHTKYKFCCRGPLVPTPLRLEEQGNNNDDDNDFFFLNHGGTTTASQLEQFLARRRLLAVECCFPTTLLSEDEEYQNNDAVVVFAPRYDAHWLKCYQETKIMESSNPLRTVLGIYEDEGNPHDLPVQITSYIARDLDTAHTDTDVDAVKKNDHGDDDGAYPCGCQPLHSDWKRREKSTSTTATTTSLRKEPYPLHCIDLRSIPDLEFLSTPEGVWHFLTSLLGNTHWRNPWVEDNDIDNEPSTEIRPEMMVLLLPRSMPTLRDFRVSDACPAWFFHGYAHLEEMDSDSSKDTPSTTSSAGGAVMYMYKRLKQRIRLSPQPPPHASSTWGDTTDISTTTSTVPIGCLWETTNGRQEQQQQEDDVDDDEGTANPTTYRLVSPPYLNLEQEYGTEIAQALFSSETIEVFRQEALQIPQWTPWPETQHYSSSNEVAQVLPTTNGEPITTWSVFPLCYCFPSNDVSKRTWVEQTRHFCPQTCQRLESILGNTLRTALFSQLQPQTVLEAHTGWADLANDVLRLHIPLIVPSSSSSLCGTWVDGCVETHQTGRPLLFDDSKIHRAFNYHPTEARIVLIVDLARPPSFLLPPGTATGGHSEELDQFIAQMSGGPK